MSLKEISPGSTPGTDGSVLAPRHPVSLGVIQMDPMKMRAKVTGNCRTPGVNSALDHGRENTIPCHIAIAVYFIGPFIDPVRNEWVIYAGLIGCVLVIPLALVCGPLRGIPLYWRLIDCSFGVLGAIPLLYCLHLTRLLKAVPKHLPGSA